jgi:phospholipid/cholesterol/gamma-HCH transport system ATP-binding protein
VDYVYYLSQGHIVAQGTPDEMRANPDPLVRQFVYGKADGPVNYQYPSRPIAEELAV